VKTFQPYRFLLAGIVVLASAGAQSPCAGDNTSRRFAVNGTGLASAIPFTGVVASVQGDATLVTAEWKQGMGCPTNLPAPYACFASSDPADTLNTGLFLAKAGPTTSDPLVDLSAYPVIDADLLPYAAAELQGVAGAKVADLTELGYDLRKPDSNALSNPVGSHCGLRSPRFSVVTTGASGATTTHRFYCVNGFLPIDGANQGWVRLRWTPDQADPAMDPADTIQSIKIIFDEGVDPVGGSPDIFGLVVLDNIDVNGILVGSAPAAAPPPPGGGDEDDGQGEDEEENSFHFRDSWSNPEKGRLSYSDKSRKLKFVAKGGARSVHSSGASCVAFVAEGTVNHKSGYTATFEACDLGTKIGTFSISITGPNGYAYKKSGKMTKGKLRLRG
jgi:hypothetical protein